VEEKGQGPLTNKGRDTRRRVVQVKAKRVKGGGQETKRPEQKQQEKKKLKSEGEHYEREREEKKTVRGIPRGYSAASSRIKKRQRHQRNNLKDIAWNVPRN